MKRVATAVVLIPLVTVILFKAPFLLFASVVFVIAILAAREYLQLAAATNLAPLIPASLLLLSIYVILRATTGTTLPWGLWPHTATWASTVISLSPLVLLIVAMFTRDFPRVLTSAGSSFLVIPYVGMTLSDLFFIRRQNGGPLLIFFFLLIIWIGDASAYYVGRSLGTHRLAPAISPNKSWEGTTASFVGSILTGLLLFHFVAPIANALVWLDLMGSQTVMNVDSGFHNPPAWGQTVLFAAVTNAAAQVGDLLESAMKRGAGVKDSGTLLPGHGGILDRVDALLLALPVLWYYAIFLLKNHLWFLP